MTVDNVPFLVAALLIQVPLMLVLPVLLGWWLRRRFHIGWDIFGAGALTFIASQALHLPANYAMGLLGGGRGVALWPLPLVAVVAGLSAGIFEEMARWVVLTFLLKRARGWHSALQFGAGHGAVEAVILGVLVVLTLVNMLVLRSVDPAALGVSGAALEQTRAAVAAYWNSAWYLPVLGGLERVAAITAHIAFTVLVMRAVTRRQPAYLLAAILGHALMDAWTVYPGAGVVGVIGVEAGVFAFALGGLYLIWRLREPLPVPDAPQPAAPMDAALPEPRPETHDQLASRIGASRFDK